MDFELKSSYGIYDLLDIMWMLRSPEGCPWDNSQTHDSIRKDLIEETYEVIDAIDRKDYDLLREELGDVLLQVVFHSVMEEEAGRFGFEDVCDELCRKLIERHPHVFRDVVAETPEEVLNNWDAIKRGTKKQALASDAVDDVPRTLPALMRAQKVQKRASKSGMDFSGLADAAAKVPEELSELMTAAESGDADKIAEELGDLLFSVVNIARFAKADAEEALTKATNKFSRRFRAVEELAMARGIDLKTAQPQLIDSLWEEVKQ